MFAYDYDLVGYKRSMALEMSYKEKDSKTFVAFKDGNCFGFGSIKISCLDSGWVGPLYADDPSVAEVLLRKLLEEFPVRKGFAMMAISSNV
ncbi:n-acetyltransferase domain-containing protein [Trichonephila clavipes]|nr:n-acetyltransferase domain-containing protein [Trichonephila clavipes]